MNLTGKSTARLVLYLAFCAAILLVPSVLDDAFLLNKYSRYLVFAILAVDPWIPTAWSQVPSAFTRASRR